MQNISSFGLTATVVASNTFPNGFPVSAWADDADPLSSPDLDVGDTAMGMNGDLLTWTRPMSIEVDLNVIPGSPEDTNLDVLTDANRLAKGKTSARDIITISFVYPSGLTINLSSGIIVSGPVMPGVASQGRLKTRQYKFKFEQVTKSGQ